MDYYYHELEKLEKELHDVLHEYPLFKEMLDEIFDKDLKEIDELLEKNDEFYLKTFSYWRINYGRLLD